MLEESLIISLFSITFIYVKTNLTNIKLLFLFIRSNIPNFYIFWTKMYYLLWLHVWILLYWLGLQSYPTSVILSPLRIPIKGDYICCHYLNSSIVHKINDCMLWLTSVYIWKLPNLFIKNEYIKFNSRVIILHNS